MGLLCLALSLKRLKRWVTMHSFNGRMSVGVQICTPWCQVLVDHSFADFTWELIPRYDGSEEYSLRVDTREYTDSDIVLSERLDSKTMCSLSLKFENDVLTWMQYRETKID